MATLNGKRLLAYEIRGPRVGEWRADVEVDTDEKLTGAAELDDGVVRSGTILEDYSGVYSGRFRARIVGGAGGLSTTIPARNYASTQGVTAAALLADICRECGEVVSSTADPSKLSTRFDKWHRERAPAKHAITLLAEKLGCVWRVLADGTIWVGVDTYPTATLTHTLIDEDWSSGILLIAPEAPTLEPGTTFLGHRLEHVVHRLTSQGGKTRLRTEAHTTSPSTALSKFLGVIQRKIDYSRPYPAKVSKQNADETLQIVPDDARFKGGGLDRVPIRRGLPGITKIEVPAGVRCTLEFEGGDPSRPAVTAFEPGGVTLVEFDNGEKSIARVDDKVETEFFLQFVPGSGGAAAQLFVRSPGGTWSPVATSVTPPVDGVTDGTQCQGRIAEGNDKLKA